MKRLLLALLLWPTLALADYQTVVAADSPCHWWHLGETSGTNAADSGACTAKNGTYTGGFTLNQTGIPGYPTNAAVSFNGSTGYVITGNSAEFIYDATSGHGNTWEFWVMQNDTTGKTVVGVGDATHYNTQLFVSTTFQFIIYEASTVGSSANCPGGTYGGTGAQGSATTGTWYHYVGTTAGGGGTGATYLANMKLYVNASLLTTISSFTPGSGIGVCSNISTEFANIGRRNDGVGYSNATVDEVAFYLFGAGTGELSQARVTAHYNAGINPPANPAGLNNFSVKRPQLPRFRDDDYFTKMVRNGYNTGLFTVSAKRPLGVGFFAPFTIVPDGHGH